MAASEETLARTREMTGICLPARNWGWFAVRGALLLALGILALVFPGAALFAFALVFAAFCFADGVLAVASGIRGARHKDERWGALIVAGVLGIAVGVVFVLFPVLGTIAYALTAILLIAAWAVATGLLEIVAAWRLRREIEGEWLLIVSGALSILLGIGLLALLWAAPAPTLASVAWLIGLWALIGAVALFALAWRLRRHSHENGGTASPHDARPAA